MNKYIELVQIDNKYILIEAIRNEISTEINNVVSNPFDLKINSYFYNLKSLLYILVNLDLETAKKELDLIIKDERYLIKLNKYKNDKSYKEFI